MAERFHRLSAAVYHARWRILFVLSPAIMILVMQALYTGLPVTSYIPYVNDELGWYKMTKAVVDYGMPLGYYGYNGTHALFGTFGSWSILSFLPYVLFGKLFGWEPYSPVLANITFLCLANLSFLLFARPKEREQKWLVMVSCLNFAAINFSITAMAECTRMALAIVLCGIFYRLMEGRSKWFFKYLFVPLFLLLCIQIFLPFVILVPVYVWLLLKNATYKWWLVVPISVFVVSMAVGVSMLLIKLTSAQFFELSQMDQILGYMKEHGLLQGISYALHCLVNNLEKVDIPHMFWRSGEFLGAFMLLFWGMMLLMACLLIVRRKRAKPQEKHILWLSLYMLAGFLLAYCMMYNAWLDRLGRGMLVAFTFVLYLNGMNQNKYPLRIAALASCCAMFVFSAHFADTAEKRFLPEPEAAPYLEYREQVDALTHISPENSRWDNTVAIYLDPTHALLSMPDGAGYNFMSGGVARVELTNARYALIDKEKCRPADTDAVRRVLLAGGHRVLLETELFVLLERAPAPVEG